MLMKPLGRVVLGMLLLAVLAGCGPTTYRPEPDYPDQAGATQVPARWYGYDPAMAHWYQPPYFDPNSTR